MLKTKEEIDYRLGTKGRLTDWFDGVAPGAERIELALPVVVVEADGGVDAFASTKLHRLPLSPIDAVHLRSGINNMESMADPFILACPHSVSTETLFKSVATVIESPLFMIMVVVGSSLVANFTPATSGIGISAGPQEARTGIAPRSVNEPVMRCPLIKSTDTVIGPVFADFIGTELGATGVAGLLILVVSGAATIAGAAVASASWDLALLIRIKDAIASAGMNSLMQILS